MKRKRGIPLVALVIFIALLVAIIVTCVIILGLNKDNQSDSTTNQQVASNQTAEPSTSPAEDDKGEEIESEDLINSDADIAGAYKLTGNKKTFAKYAIYASGGFDEESNNIRNDLKLQLAMAQVTNSDMDKEGSAKSVSKDKVEKYAKDIFENADDIEYKDFSLYDSDTNFINQYKTTGYTYDKNTASYEIQESDVEESTPPEVTEVITKAVKYNSKMEIYVKPIFTEPFFSEEINAEGCQLFKNYDFQMKEFPEDDLLKAFAYSDYKGTLRTDSTQDLDGYVYSTLSQYVDLNAIKDYKYTFTKTDDGYKLKSFELADTDNANESSTSESVTQEMSEQDKAMFNSRLEAFIGSEKRSSDVKMLIETIITTNASATDDSRIISVKLDDVEEDGKDTDKLKEMENTIEASKKYEVKATYKSKLITSVTITTITE